MPLWPMIGNDCCLGVESVDNDTVDTGAFETVGWMLLFWRRMRECGYFNFLEEKNPETRHTSYHV
jgi:hypothetical protein